MKTKTTKTIPAIPALLLALLISPLAAKELQVFILAGQSNMVGHGKLEEGRDPALKPGEKGRNVKGGIGSLRWVVNENRELYAAAGKTPLVDDQGGWLTRDDVYIISTVERSDRILKGKLGARNHFGPEYSFGHVMGNANDAPVLIIKTAWGGKDLAVDFRPPSSGKWTKGKGKREQGKYYRLMLSMVRDGLASFGKDFPELKGLTPRIAGFGWHQGWNDGCSDKMVAEYETNMANFIRDVRKDLGVKDLPFVIANSGMTGYGKDPEKSKTDRRQILCEIQMAMGDPEKHPEFKGTVASVETRGFHRTADQSPSNFGFHWKHNGESHFLVGKGIAEAMLGLMK